MCSGAHPEIALPIQECAAAGLAHSLCRSLQRLFPLCYLRCLLFGSQRLTEANEGNEEEIPAPKNFVLRPSKQPRSNQYCQTVCFKPFICRDNGKVIHFGGGDDKSVARVVVNRRKLDGGDADVQVQRENSKPMMLDNVVKPLLRRTGQLELCFGRLGGDFKTADG